jgi:hypothetical protein
MNIFGNIKFPEMCNIMNSKTNDSAALEQERENLHALIQQNGKKPLSNCTLVEQSQKLDNIIVSIQKERQQRKNE